MNRFVDTVVSGHVSERQRPPHLRQRIDGLALGAIAARGSHRVVAWHFHRVARGVSQPRHR